ncbi:MAG: hypothetical protein AAGA75_28275 [Cyanobacteria bacterium P01_E01_bin.6]
MFDSLIEQIQKAVSPEIVAVDGNVYVSRRVELPPSEPMVTPLETQTLQSIIDYINSDFDGISADLALIIHVLSPTEVHLIDAVEGRHNTRNQWLIADCSEVRHNQFPFDRFLDVETFIIKTQAFFVPSKVRSQLLQCVSSVDASESLQANDDGVSQTATVKKGVRLSLETIPNPVELKPYRTFSEIEQPSSDFIFRIKKEGDEIKAALFESGSAQWKLEAITSIADFLKARLPKVTTIS